MNSTQHVVVTGGASGLGEAIAKKWASMGAEVCIADINQTAAENVCQQIIAAGGSAFFKPCDITNIESINGLKTALMSRWQHIDVLINNAGVATADKIEDEPMAQWRWVFEINLFGMVNMCQSFVPLMKRQGHGAILNVASQAGLTPIPFMSSYNASKAAVVSLSETMHLELADNNIHVSVLCPSFFKTNLGNSLRTQLPSMEKMLGKIFDKSPINSTDVAQMAFDGLQAKNFIILTHKQAKQAYFFKRFLPTKWYLNNVLKQTQKLRSVVKGASK